MSWRRAVVLASVLLGAAGCGRYEEILRVPSPDGVVEAVVVEVEAGGGNPFAYQVHVVARGAREPLFGPRNAARGRRERSVVDISRARSAIPTRSTGENLLVMSSAHPDRQPA